MKAVFSTKGFALSRVAFLSPHIRCSLRYVGKHYPESCNGRKRQWRERERVITARLSEQNKKGRDHTGISEYPVQ